MNGANQGTGSEPRASCPVPLEQGLQSTSRNPLHCKAQAEQVSGRAFLHEARDGLPRSLANGMAAAWMARADENRSNPVRASVKGHSGNHDAAGQKGAEPAQNAAEQH